MLHWNCTQETLNLLYLTNLPLFHLNSVVICALFWLVPFLFFSLEFDVDSTCSSYSVSNKQRKLGNAALVRAPNRGLFINQGVILSTPILLKTIISQQDFQILIFLAAQTS